MVIDESPWFGVHTVFTFINIQLSLHTNSMKRRLLTDVRCVCEKERKLSADRQKLWATRQNISDRIERAVLSSRNRTYCTLHTHGKRQSQNRSPSFKNTQAVLSLLHRSRRQEHCLHLTLEQQMTESNGKSLSQVKRVDGVPFSDICNSKTKSAKHVIRTSSRH